MRYCTRCFGGQQPTRDRGLHLAKSAQAQETGESPVLRLHR